MPWLCASELQTNWNQRGLIVIVVVEVGSKMWGKKESCNVHLWCAIQVIGMWEWVKRKKIISNQKIIYHLTFGNLTFKLIIKKLQNLHFYKFSIINKKFNWLEVKILKSNFSIKDWFKKMDQPKKLKKTQLIMFFSHNWGIWKKVKSLG